MHVDTCAASHTQMWSSSPCSNVTISWSLSRGPFQMRIKNMFIEQGVMQGTAGGEAFQFGAARDSQTAADTSALSGNVSTGAATFSFIQAIEQGGPYLTYGQLLFNMDATLNKMNGGSSGGGFSNFSSINPFDPISLVSGLMGGGGGGSSGQTPVMSSNTPFDFNRQFHI